MHTINNYKPTNYPPHLDKRDKAATPHKPTIPSHYKGVDVLKFAMALCVIMIHVIALNKPWNPGTGIDYLISLAVPFFFIASGFMLSSKTALIATAAGRNAAIRKYALRILKMYACWIAIYIPLSIWGEYANPSEESMLRFAIVQLRSVFMFGEIRYSYPTWYLYSLCIAATAYYFIRRKGLPVITLLICGIAGITLQYIVSQEVLPKTAGNLCLSVSRMTIGMGYLWIGIMFQRHMARVMRPGIAAIAGATSCLLYLLDLPFWETVGSIAIFILAATVPSAGIGTKAALWMRRQSLWIYLTHMYVLTPLALSGMIGSPWWQYAVVAALCVVISQGLMAFSDTSRGAFLKKIT